MTTSLSCSRRDVQISAAILAVTTPFVAEVLSSNVSPWAFFVLAWGLIPVYGFPILLIREWAIRCGVSLGGILLAGFGYGLFNEGLIAKTLFLNQRVPWNLFDGRIGWGGVNWGWLLVICAYHALFSILTPLLLIEHLRPKTAGVPWLSPRSMLALGGATALISTAYFSQKPATIPVGFWLLWGAIGACVLLGSLCRSEWKPSSGALTPRALVWSGAAFLPVLLVMSGAFAHGLWAGAFAVLWATWMSFTLRNVARGGAQGALLVGLGAFGGMSAMNILVAAPVAKVVGVAALTCIVWWLRTRRLHLDRA